LIEWLRTNISLVAPFGTAIATVVGGLWAAYVYFHPRPVPNPAQSAAPSEPRPPSVTISFGHDEKHPRILLVGRNSLAAFDKDAGREVIIGCFFFFFASLFFLSITFVSLSIVHVDGVVTFISLNLLLLIPLFGTWLLSSFFSNQLTLLFGTSTVIATSELLVIELSFFVYSVVYTYLSDGWKFDRESLIRKSDGYTTDLPPLSPYVRRELVTFMMAHWT
jgi:hypothetical protein